MSESLGRMIRERRHQLGITQGEFASLLGEGVRQAEVSRLECGLVARPRPERIRVIARVLDVPMDELTILAAGADPDTKAARWALATPAFATVASESVP